MISNGLHYIVTDQDSIELYHYINDPSEMSSLHESPEHMAILAGFRRLGDSLAASVLEGSRTTAHAQQRER